MRARHMLLGISVISLLSAGAATAEQPVTLPVFASGGIAIRGHDPVAYFRDGRPVRGSAAFAHAWQGVIWRFASAANRDAFAAEPDRYAPQYGGFCAFAVANGYSAPIDPAAWRIVAGRLYLNYDRATQRRWESDIPGNIARADANWPSVAAGLAAR